MANQIPGTNFRTINYGKALYETLRGYFSINAAGELSILYSFCAALVALFQTPFNNYAAFRQQQALIANCKWQIGQLTNVLNMLFDPINKSIFITQSVILSISDPTFAYPPVNQDDTFGYPSTAQERKFTDKAAETLVTFNIPNTVSVTAITAVINQICLLGIPYNIVVF